MGYRTKQSIGRSWLELIENEVNNMADTGEDREIKQRANANEAKVVRKSKKLASKTKADLNMRKNASGTAPGARSESNKR